MLENDVRDHGVTEWSLLHDHEVVVKLGRKTNEGPGLFVHVDFTHLARLHISVNYAKLKLPLGRVLQRLHYGFAYFQFQATSL